MRITENFTTDEFLRSDKAKELNIINKFDNASQLCAIKELCNMVLQPSRDHFGKPIIINSGFRNKKLNKAVGGVPTSQHAKGEAADIRLSDYTENKQLFNYIQNNLNFDQLIWEYGSDSFPAWVHVSYSDGNNRKEVLRAKKVNGKTQYVRL